MARIKRKKSIGMYVILATSITMLNFLGISYASLNNGLNIISRVNTGTMDVSFAKDFVINKLQNDGKLDIGFDDKYKMNIKGKIDSKYKGSVKYGVNNNGDIPAKFIKQNIKCDEGLKIKINQQKDTLKPKEFLDIKNQSSNLQIEAATEGRYNFEIELLYRQGNN